MASRRRDALGLGEAAGAGVAAGEAAFLGVDHVHAAGAQHGEVLLDGGVLPHLGVHRGGEQDGRLRRQQRGGEEIVGDAVCVLADDAGGGRRHDDQQHHHFTSSTEAGDFVASRITIGTAPDSWGVWFPSDPEQVPASVMPQLGIIAQVDSARCCIIHAAAL